MKKYFFLLCLTIFSIPIIGQWKQVNSGTNKLLSNGCFVDRNIGWVSSYGGSLIHTEDGGKTWNSIKIADERVNFLDVHFVDKNIGFAVGTQNVIMKTTDCGKTWNGTQFNFNYVLRSIESHDNIVVMGGGQFDSYGITSGILLISFDYGETWKTTYTGRIITAVDVPSENSIHAFGTSGVYYRYENNSWIGDNFTDIWLFGCKFIDENNGWVVGGNDNNYNSIFKTSDGGKTWYDMSIEDIPQCLFGVDFVDENIGYVSGGWDHGESANYISKTTDGGNTWKTFTTSNKSLQYIKVFDKDNAIAFGHDGYVIKTSNGGGYSDDYLTNIWNWNVYKVENNYKTVAFRNNELGFAFGSNIIGKTINGGMNWSITQTNFDYGIKSSIISSDQVFAVGTEGTIIASEDSGKSWLNRNAGTTSNLSGIANVNDSTLMICGDNGTILRSIDRGFTWENIYSPSSSNLAKIDFHDNVGIIVGGTPQNDYSSEGVILRSSDYGLTWEVVKKDIPILTDIDMVSTLKGKATGIQGYLYSTFDSGLTWNLEILSDYYLFSVKYVNDNSVVVTGGNYDNGIIIESFNDSKKWYGIRIPQTKQLWDVTSYNDIAWVVGDGGYMFKTDSVKNIMPEFMITSVDEEIIVPTSTTLYQNYPNPFNPETLIKYYLEKSTYVTLDVYNTLGEKVASLLNGYIQSGEHTINFKANNLPSGIYFYNLVTDDNSLTKKFILLK